jgi:hypothetical protein
MLDLEIQQEEGRMLELKGQVVRVSDRAKIQEPETHILVVLKFKRYKV